MSLIQNVSDKALYFKKKSEQLDTHVLELQQEIAALKQDLNERNEELFKLKAAREVQNISQESQTNTSVDLNDRIDELVREIDACLMHLKKYGMAKLSIKVVVAGRNYPLTIDESEKESVERAAEDINKRIQFLRDNYAVKDVQDLLAMTALQVAVKKSSSEASPYAKVDLTEPTKVLSDLLEQLNK